MFGGRAVAHLPVWSSLRGEAIASVDWRAGEAHQLIVGLASKWIRVLDTRMPHPVVSLVRPRQWGRNDACQKVESTALASIFFRCLTGCA